MARTLSRSARLLAPLLPAVLALAACGEKEPTTFEPGATDVSGGELKVEPVKPGEVPVNVPEVPMTPVPDASASASASPTPAASASATPAQ